MATGAGQYSVTTVSLRAGMVGGGGGGGGGGGVGGARGGGGQEGR